MLDHALDLVDSLTFNTKAIPGEMWPIFEEIYKLFKNGVIDFLDGSSDLYHQTLYLTRFRNAAVSGQLYELRKGSLLYSTGLLRNDR